MPRPRNAVPKVRWLIYLPEDLAGKLDILLMNPITRKVQYNARPQLVEMLLRKWLEERSKQSNVLDAG